MLSLSFLLHKWINQTMPKVLFDNEYIKGNRIDIHELTTSFHLYKRIFI